MSPTGSRCREPLRGGSMKRIRPGQGGKRGPPCDHISDCDFPTSAETAGKNESPHPGSFSSPLHPTRGWQRQQTSILGFLQCSNPQGWGTVCLSVCLSLLFIPFLPFPFFYYDSVTPYPPIVPSNYLSLTTGSSQIIWNTHTKQATVSLVPLDPCATIILRLECILPSAARRGPLSAAAGSRA